MEQGTVRWFNDAKGFGSSAIRVVRMCLYITQQSIHMAPKSSRGIGCKFSVVESLRMAGVYIQPR